ncbi:hypothetical protein QYE76_035844 [Lolium multiflorum]|uniref:non-specific serine/threonine protein kinase n=1 Tax=Lolium multiflorum TaxID=4521 RepID=A0AAD8VNV6_LOLMU|nr:hypothetical protein QYE76_035844 [Lolium multiflorum]
MPRFLHLFTLLFYLRIPASSAATDTILAGQALAVHDKLVSSNGRYALGFFKPNSSKSSQDTTNWYLGIWFNTVPTFTPAWVANRDKPIKNTTSVELTISQDGNLVIQNESTKSIIWSTQANITTNSTTAILLSSGNLILTNSSNQSEVLWQSFDHPTDTFFPGAKLGWDKVTGLNRSFVSWKNLIDPAAGGYRYELDPSGIDQLLLVALNSSTSYWSTGPWSGKYFSSIPEMAARHSISAKFVKNDRERSNKDIHMDEGLTGLVKRLDGAYQGEKQFRAEVSSIGAVQHINLVKLVGFCCEDDKRLLVYEYMSNHSLDVHLFRSNSTVLSWAARYQIALGVARGLAYLHESCRDCIIHCDIKPENILLDASFLPKVADFGMAKLLARDFSRVLTTMRGTAGYLAPEWITGVAITPKVDVYSYGMVLLEIISGRRNTCAPISSNVDVYFPVQAAHKLLEGDVRSLVDHKLQGDVNLDEAELACKVACWCIQDDELDRPTMGEVVQILEGLTEIRMPPIPRLLQTMFESCS